MGSLATLTATSGPTFRGSGDDNWTTPSRYLEAACRVLGTIDFDPASSQQAQEIVQARTYYTVEDDGLSQRWRGRLWLNPPYLRTVIDQFIAKLLAHFSLSVRRSRVR
jgi:ParB family chromosome partitioning protein